MPAEIGDDRTRFADARGLKAYAGASLITRALALRPPRRRAGIHCSYGPYWAGRRSGRRLQAGFDAHRSAARDRTGRRRRLSAWHVMVAAG
ncbi:MULTISPECIES: hypothetical protein [unclassified Streptomyces]|uniref:hypothetical protein n=1 Tax=unclassified Streptomyces TaxID=2593676 RepID=UPI0033BD8FAA